MLRRGFWGKIQEENCEECENYGFIFGKLDKRRKWDIDLKWLNNENEMVKDLKYSFMLYTWTAKKTFDKLSGRQNHLPAAGRVIKRSCFYAADCGPYRGMVTCRSHWASSWGRWVARAS